MRIPKRINQVQPPIIQELQRVSTGNTLSLAQGVPFFPPPEDALKALKERMSTLKMHTYSPDAGLPGLREALAEKLKAENGIPALPDEVMVTAGANQGFVNAVLAIADPGDEVLLLRPYYFNHEMAGKTLRFAVEVVDIRDAAPEELSHGHVHGPGGHHH